MTTLTVFTYPDYGTPDNHPELTAHSGQQVTVLRELDPIENDTANRGPAFAIRFADGLEHIAFAEELEPEPKHNWVYNDDTGIWIQETD